LDAPARAPQARGVDLELHLLAVLWRKPELLLDANVALTRASLETLAEDDFINPVLRVAFRQISRTAMGREFEPAEMDDFWLQLLAEHDLSSLLDDADELKLREESVRTALRLREHNLARERTNLSLMIDSARQNGERDIASRYNLELSKILTKWFKAQKALQLRNGLNSA
jgi:hypothetical protein